MRNLRREGYDVAYPRMPDEADPRFDRWSAAIAREIDAVGPSILVGHSYGGTVLIHTLAAHGRLLNNITAICLIAAPFMGQGTGGQAGWSSDEITLVDGWANPLANFPLHLFHGGADTIVPKAHVDLYAEALPHAQVYRLAGQDHQLNNDLTEVAKVLRL